MSATCRFCGQQYANSQAVRAHLKGCVAYAAYKARPGKALANEGSLRERRRGVASLGNETPGSIPTEDPDQAERPFDPVHQLGQRLAAERIRLQLREVEDAHSELDRRAESKERERQQQAEQKAMTERMAERDRENAQRLAEDNRREREHCDTVARERTGRRREVIQSVKHQLVEQWLAPIFGRSDLKARAMQDIERELTALPVEDLPRTELVLIAEGIRDRIYQDAVQAGQRSQEQANRRQRLIEQGCAYASTELRDVEGLALGARWKIESRVRDELAAVEGNETTADIEEWVDEILEDEGIEWDDEDD